MPLEGRYWQYWQDWLYFGIVIENSLTGKAALENLAKSKFVEFNSM
jgi:hypothetical protein